MLRRRSKNRSVPRLFALIRTIVLAAIGMNADIGAVKDRIFSNHYIG